MAVENIFEYATRHKVRFPFKGNLSVEDLWDLRVEDLDQIFKTLHTKQKQSQEESLLNTKNKEEELIDIQIAIIKYIVVVKLAEKEAQKKAAENKAKKQKIMAIMAARDEKALENSSDEELRRMLEELGES